MPDTAPNAQLMRSLGRLVRGLSALFWGLPISFLICYYTARAESLRTFGVVPALACTGLLVYGLWQLGSFQPQERVWRLALDRARLLGLINFGLSPFLYWWNKVPANPLFLFMVSLMAVAALLFLSSLNRVLQRLGAMLPDETLRVEIKQFTALNLNLIWTTLLIGTAYFTLSYWQNLSPPVQAVMEHIERVRFWLLVLMVLLPLAMTMAMLWKTKEVILDNVFGPKP